MPQGANPGALERDYERAIWHIVRSSRCCGPEVLHARSSASDRCELVQKFTSAQPARTSSVDLTPVVLGTRLLSDCKYLHVSDGSGNSAWIAAMHCAQLTGREPCSVNKLLLTWLCFFLEDTRGPLFLSVLNCSDAKHLLRRRHSV